MRRRLLVIALAAALGGCTGLVFHPMQEHVLAPDQIGLAYRDVWFEAADGVRLHGWLLPAAGQRQGSVLFLHGNAQNISTHIASVAWLPEAGFDVFLPDYRGYGRSEGEPSLAGLHLDFEASLDALAALPGVDADRLVVLGQSLGGALAITGLAGAQQKDRIHALVIEGGFTSYRALAREKLGDLWVTWALQWPLSLTIDDRYRPIDAIGELAPLPILIVHGVEDRVVPVDHGLALFEAAGEPKSLWLISGADHIQTLASPEARRRLVDWLNARLAPRALADARPGPRLRGRRPPPVPRRPRPGRPDRAPAAAAGDRLPRSPAPPAHP